MATLIKAEQKQIVKEGFFFNKWLENRFLNNKNVLTAITGQTGSSKSYQDLRRAELWYRKNFNEDYPEDNICFSVAELMKRITSKNLRKGDIFVFEEAGANLGSLDFQTKISKMFNYVLQSFRSMNVGIFFNLPHLSMLNKQARILIHVHFVTHGIDFKKGVATSKAFFRQVNQDTGKIYGKYMRVNFNGFSVPIKKFKYSLPSPELIKKYEDKKARFLLGLNREFLNYIIENQKEDFAKTERKPLTERQQEVYDLYRSNKTMVEVGKILDLSPSTIAEYMKAIRKKGYDLPKNNIKKKKHNIQKDYLA